MTAASIVTISGDLGSGKSTVAKLLAERLGVPYLSTGAFQRQIATRRGLTSLELNRIAEQDKSIDSEIDRLTAELEQQGRPVVVDSRMAWHFIASSLRVYLIVDEVVGAERISRAARDSEVKYQNVEQALQANRERRKSELLRFKNLYDVDLQDWKNFDLVVNTSVMTPEQVAAVVMHQALAPRSRDIWPKYFTSPKACFPTDRDAFRSAARGLAVVGERASMCELINVRGVDLLWRDEVSVRDAILQRSAFIEAKVIATQESDLLPTGLHVSKFLSLLPTRSALYDWEDALGFQFYRYPDWFAEG